MRANWPAIEKKILKDFPSVQGLTVDELESWLNDNTRVNPVILDARTKREYGVSHLKDAVHAETAQQAIELVGDKPCVIYCSVGYRSARLADELSKEGHANVFNLNGSIFEWVNTGRRVYRQGDIVERVHPFDKKWGQLLKEEFRHY